MRIVTGGESHGPALVAVVEDVPSQIPLSVEQVDRQLARRRMGYGRGPRMGIETDAARILSGVRNGLTLGTPVTLLIRNADHENWLEVMSPGEGLTVEPETRPRPGHADMAGMLKHGTPDARNVLERASARETAARVAGGAVARRFLEELGIEIRSRVVAIGPVADDSGTPGRDGYAESEKSVLRCLNPDASRGMVEAVDEAARCGDSLGGVFEVAAFGLPPGIGSYSSAGARLDGRLFAALASIPAIKGVEAGSGFAAAAARGSEVHDEMFPGDGGVSRASNRAGGLEGGMTNGEPVVLRAAMKPIPSLAIPLSTVDLDDMSEAVAFKERADVCAVPAAAVVGEAAVAVVLSRAVQEKFGSDALGDIRASMDHYLRRISRHWKRDW